MSHEELLEWMGKQDAASLVRGQDGWWTFYWQLRGRLHHVVPHPTWWAALTVAKVESDEP